MLRKRCFNSSFSTAYWPAISRQRYTKKDAETGGKWHLVICFVLRVVFA